MKPTHTVAFLIFDDVEELDFVGPWEALGYLATIEPTWCAVHTVSRDGGVVRCVNGLRVVADHSFATAPAASVIVVPGGNGRKKAMVDPATLDFVRQTAATATAVMSVCSGAFILHRAGLLEGLTATTYHGCLDELDGCAGVTVARGQRFVDNGKILTAAGVSAGIDCTLHLIGKLYSPQVARRVQDGIEYHPEPPVWT